MTREFYNALQMDPSVLKRRIAACGTKGEKAFYWAAMAVRSELIVAFAILFISLLSGLFGADNTPLAVVLFCMLLGIRFVDFDYCIAGSMAALGVSLVLAAGQAFGVERFMWMGFACGSLLSEYPLPQNAAVRFWQRIVGAAAGCGLFALLYLAVPPDFRSLLGPLGGFCMGFCTDYRYKTAMNCIGALMIGAGLYGLQGAVVLRLADTVLGVTFALVFAALFRRLTLRFLPGEKTAL